MRTIKRACNSVYLHIFFYPHSCDCKIQSYLVPRPWWAVRSQSTLLAFYCRSSCSYPHGIARCCDIIHQILRPHLVGTAKVAKPNGKKITWVAFAELCTMARRGDGIAFEVTRLSAGLKWLGTQAWLAYIIALFPSGKVVLPDDGGRGSTSQKK